MVEKIGTIKNPLTIIAIFAGIAEVSGTVVLPFISDNMQDIFVWFLVLFPTTLVSLFFLTLNFNHKVLYAPSDFQEDTSFLKLFEQVTPIEKVEKFKKETEEENNILNEPDKPSKPANIEDTKEFILPPNIDKESSRTQHFLAQELVFKKLQKEMTNEIRKELALKVKDRKFIFDGITMGNNEIEIIEVKYYRTDKFNKQSLKSTLSTLQEAYNFVLQVEKLKSHIVMAFVLDASNPEIAEIIVERVRRIVSNYHFPLDTRFYELSDLKMEFGLN